MIGAVSFRRCAAAPRLIDWTGERCVPWAPDVQVVYEHMHRYLWAAQLVGGKRVLDLDHPLCAAAALLRRRGRLLTQPRGLARDLGKRKPLAHRIGHS